MKPRMEVKLMKPPFRRSERYHVGLHVIQGLWYSIYDCNGEEVAQVPVRESEENALQKAEERARELVGILNQGHAILKLLG